MRLTAEANGKTLGIGTRTLNDTDDYKADRAIVWSDDRIKELEKQLNERTV